MSVGNRVGERDTERENFLSNTLLPLCDVPVRQVIVGGELQVCDKRALTSSRQRLHLMSHMLYQILIAFKPLLHKQTVTLSGFTELDKHFSFIPPLSVLGANCWPEQKNTIFFLPPQILFVK